MTNLEVFNNLSKQLFNGSTKFFDDTTDVNTLKKEENKIKTRAKRLSDEEREQKRLNKNEYLKKYYNENKW